MKTWQHKVVTFVYNGYPSLDLREVDTYLDNLGKSGWEPYSVETEYDGNRVHARTFFLKRSIESL